MLSFILMIGFSLYLMAYGFLAVFRKDIIWKLRSFSAKVEGKSGEKRDEESTQRMNQMGNIMGTAALILGTIGLIVSVMTMVIYLQAQNGGINL